MSTAFAHTLAAAREVHLAVVMAHASCRALVGSLLAGVLQQRSGTVAVLDLDDLPNDLPDAVVLVADGATTACMAALRRIRRHVPAAPLVVVARDDRSATTARQVLNAGADAFVAAGEAAETLVPALDAAMAGLVCVPRRARRLVAKPIFSHREKEVLELLVEGLTNRQIAARLFLAESTVKTHLVSAFAQLGVRSRKDAVALLLDPAEGLATTALPPGAAPEMT
jgi:DNA-binding NarL/FixJ family response regulator